jgi:hypothetical protein
MTTKRAQHEQLLLQNIHKQLEDLKGLLDTVSDHWGYEDPIYRFYHQSFKVFLLQDSTEQIVKQLKRLLPDRPMNTWFEEIIGAGTGKNFTEDANKDWLATTRPILEAFFHARYFLEMACRYGQELKSPPDILPSGYAALLYLYNLR